MMTNCATVTAATVGSGIQQQLEQQHSVATTSTGMFRHSIQQQSTTATTLSSSSISDIQQ